MGGMPSMGGKDIWQPEVEEMIVVNPSLPILFTLMAFLKKVDRQRVLELNSSTMVSGILM